MKTNDLMNMLNNYKGYDVSFNIGLVGDDSGYGVDLIKIRNIGILGYSSFSVLLGRAEDSQEDSMMKIDDLISLLEKHENKDIAFHIGYVKDEVPCESKEPVEKETFTVRRMVTAKNIIIDDISYSEKSVALGYTDEFEGELEIDY